MKSHLPLIIGMMIVTFIPRLLPMVSFAKQPLHPTVRRFLLYIPYTALGALIISGVMQSAPGMMAATLAGVIVACICSWFKGGLILSVFASIVAAFLLLL
jgi:branched-subunit amino acid transport protein